jgi:DNA-binding NarL/FixJ family response regulator
VIRLLLVDDHALFRSSLRSRLDSEPDLITVGEAGTAKQAVVAARALQPDLVLLDLVLPRTDGAEAVPDLLDASPSAKVLVVSAQAQPASVRRAISAGARGFVPKRASDTMLIDAIRRVAAGEQYVEASLGARLVVDEERPEVLGLTERERDALQLLALGYTNQEIGNRMYVSVRTVDSHRASIMRKLHFDSRAELVLFALAHGLIGAA